MSGTMTGNELLVAKFRLAFMGNPRMEDVGFVRKKWAAITADRSHEWFAEYRDGDWVVWGCIGLEPFEEHLTEGEFKDRWQDVIDFIEKESGEKFWPVGFDFPFSLPEVKGFCTVEIWADTDGDTVLQVAVPDKLSMPGAHPGYSAGWWANGAKRTTFILPNGEGFVVVTEQQEDKAGNGSWGKVSVEPLYPLAENIGTLPAVSFVFSRAEEEHSSMRATFVVPASTVVRTE